MEAWVGWSQGELTRRLGPPDQVHDRDLSVTLELRPTHPPGEHRRTLSFKTRRGRLWGWLRPEDGRWVCYESLWSCDGLRF